MGERYITLSDEEIFNLIGEESDETAFEELYDRYFKVLFNYIYSKVENQFVTQELVQELFVSIWTQRHNRSVQACRAYLFSIAKKSIISYYRREFTRKRHYSEWEQQAECAINSTDQIVLAKDLEEKYMEGLQQLPSKCREVFLLSRSGQSNRKIAEIMQISEKTVEQHITKARRQLKEFLRYQFLPTLLAMIIF
jgi:RNA polymerase sigma-70 factor (family 1)